MSKTQLEDTEIAVHENGTIEAETPKVDQDTNKILRVEQFFQGPIPHPDILRGYEKISKGSANRIIAMAEKEANHRHYLEERAAKDDSRDSLLGIIAAIVLPIAILTSGVVIAINVQSIAGVIAGTLLDLAGIGTIIKTFLANTRPSKRNEEKDKS